MSLLDLPTDILAREIIKWFRAPEELYNYMVLCREMYDVVQEEPYECNILFAITNGGIRGIRILRDMIYAHDHKISGSLAPKNFMQLLIFGNVYANYVGPKSIKIFDTSIQRKLYLWAQTPDKAERYIPPGDGIVRIVSFDPGSYTVTSLDSSVENAIAFFRDGKKIKSKIDMSRLSLNNLKRHVSKKDINRFIARKNTDSLDRMIDIENNLSIGNFCDPNPIRSYCAFTLGDIDSNSDPILIRFKNMMLGYVSEVTFSHIVSDAVDICWHEVLVGSQLLRALGNRNIPRDRDYDLAGYDIGVFKRGVARGSEVFNIDAISDRRVHLRYKDTKENGTDTCDVFMPDIPIDMFVKSFHFPCVRMYCRLESAYCCVGYHEKCNMIESWYFLPSAVIPLMTMQMSTSGIHKSLDMPEGYYDQLIEKYKGYGFKFID